MREIAKRLGFSAQAIYNYFPSKEAMVAAMVDEGLRLLEQTNPSEVLPDALDNLRFMYVRYYEFSKAHPDYFTLLFMDPVAARNFQEPQLKVIQRLGLDAARRMQRCVDEGIFPADLDLRAAGTLMWSAVHGPAVIALTGIKTAMSTDQAAKDVMEAVIEALRSGTVARRPLVVPLSDLAGQRV
jgi:AcrR family transcriptional regulator